MSGFSSKHWGEQGLIVLGDTPRPGGHGNVVASSSNLILLVDQLAQSLGWPVLPEPTAAPWLPQTFIAHAPLVLEKLAEQRADNSLKVVLAIGRVGLSRPVAKLLAREDVSKFWFAPPPLVDKFSGFDVLNELPSEVSASESCSPEWLISWQQASAEVENVITDHLSRAPFSGVHVARALTRALEPGDMVHFGSSYPARDVELYATNQPMVADSGLSDTWASGPLQAFMNRGVNGIDGVVSTAIGEALGARAPGFLFCGDLTLLHDFNGLLINAREPHPDLTIVVSDNDGGGIFSTLEHAEGDGFERVIATPLHLDLAAMLHSIGLSVETVTDETSLVRALSRRPKGISVVIARVGDREQEGRLRRQIRTSALS